MIPAKTQMMVRVMTVFGDGERCLAIIVAAVQVKSACIINQIAHLVIVALSAGLSVARSEFESHSAAIA